MDFSRALQYPFDDEEWTTKVLLGVVVSMVPILNFAATGYFVGIIRNVAHEEPRPLPRWENLGDLLTKGLYVIIAQIAYFIVPTALIGVVTVPLFVLPLLGGGNEDITAALGGLALLGTVCIGLLGLVLMLAVSLLMLAGLLRFSLGEQTLGELLDFRANYEYLRAHFSAILAGILYLFIASLLIFTVVGCIGGVLSFIPFCGQLISFALGLGAGFFIVLFAGHIYGQVARKTGLVVPAVPAPPAV